MLRSDIFKFSRADLIFSNCQLPNGLFFFDAQFLALLLHVAEGSYNRPLSSEKTVTINGRILGLFQYQRRL